MSKLSFAVLGNSNFRFLLITRMFGVMALQCQALIVGWQVYSITKDFFMLGLTGLVEAVPAILCALFAGHVVDITSPKRVFLLCMSALLLNTTILVLFAGGYIPLPGGHVLALIFTGVFISGVARSFIMPSTFSILPRIVTRKEIPAAAAWQSSTFQVAEIAGPTAAGIIYGMFGSKIAWLLPLGFMVIAISLIAFIKIPHVTEAIPKRDPAMKSIKAGWKFILQNPLLLSVMVLDMFAVLFGGAVAMLPAFADQVLHIGSEGLGLLRASPAIGAVTTAIFLAILPMRRLTAKRMLWTVAGFWRLYYRLWPEQGIWLAMLFMALSGAFDSISMVIRSTLMQLLTPDHMRGRVSSVNSMFVISSNEIGAFESGTTANLMGLVPSIVFGGVATLTVVAITALASPRLRRAIVYVDDDQLTLKT